MYRRRLPGLEIVEVRDGTMRREAEALRACLRSGERMVALSEEGERLESRAFAGRLAALASHRVAFLIGGADGLDGDLRRGADAVISLSPMTLPHDLARLVLLEQIYRARTILDGGPYHRE
jgi:23S rRNA (pseudouridine1915-N3)-methyltransferase